MSLKRYAYIYLLIIMLTGCATGYFCLDGEPKVKFKRIGFDFANISNPFWLTQDYIDNSWIVIHRLRSGDILPRGKTVIRDDMTSKEIKSLLIESVNWRKGFVLEKDVETKVAQIPACKIYYSFSEDEDKKGVSYGFQKGAWFYNIWFLADKEKYYDDGIQKFEEVVQSFEIID